MHFHYILNQLEILTAGEWFLRVATVTGSGFFIFKILVAEDEAIIAESIYQLLKDLNYDPIEPYVNKKEAINAKIAKYLI